MATKKSKGTDLGPTIETLEACASALLDACMTLQEAAAPGRHVRALQSVEPKVRAAAEALAAEQAAVEEALALAAPKDDG